MALLDIITKGAVDYSATLRMADSTDGTPETGVVAATTGLAIWYRRPGAALTTLGSLSNLAALTTAHTDSGLLHISTGEYRVDFPDAAFASGVNYVDIGWGATDMIGYGGRIRLASIDLDNAVTAGLSAFYAGAPKINTALSDIQFLMVDSSDVAQTGKTVTATVSKNGGAYGATTGTVAEVGNGTYQFDASAADMNAARLVFRFAATGCKDTFMEIVTLA